MEFGVKLPNTARIEKLFMLFLSFNLQMASNTFNLNLFVFLIII